MLRYGQVLDGLAVLFVSTGIAAIGTNAFYLHHYTAAGVFPAFSGLWFSLFIVIFSAQLALRSRLAHAMPAASLCVRTFPIGLYSYLSLVALLVSVGYFVAYRPDGGVYGLVLAFILCLNAREARASSVQQNPTDYDKLAIHVHETVPVEEWQRTNSRQPCKRPHFSILCCVRGANVSILAISSFLLTMMLGGAWLQAQGYRMYPPRGKFVDLKFPNGEMRKSHVWCTGPPPNPVLPTFFFDCGGGGHSMSDLWGLQFALNAAGRRVCTYDPPGTAWSDYSTATDNGNVLGLVIAALMSEGEPGPFILLGDMDGGPDRIYEYALSQPANVKALIPMQYCIPEMTTYQLFHNWTYSQTRSYARETLMQRRTAGDIIRGFGAMWGLIPLFAPVPTSYVPAEYARESIFLNIWNEKQWTTQVLYLQQQVNNPDLAMQPDIWTTNRNLDPNIPVFALLAPGNATTTCARFNWAPDDERCRYQAAVNGYCLSFMQSLTTMTAGSSLHLCEGCSSDDWLGTASTIPWVVSTVLAAVSGGLNATRSTG